MSRKIKLLSLLLIVMLFVAACGGGSTPPAEEPVTQPTEEPAVEEEPVEEPTEEPMEEPTEEPAEEPTEAPAEEPAEEPTEESAEEPSAGGDVVFFSTQFSPVEEQERFRAILQQGGYDFTASEEGPLIDLILAGVEAEKVRWMLSAPCTALSRPYNAKTP